MDSCTGLLIILNERTSVALQEVAPLFAGIGIGMLFHAPYQVLLKSLKADDMASATGAFFLVRFTGATCGLVSLNFTLYFRPLFVPTDYDL